MSNVSTTGYKSDTFVGTTFEEVLLYESRNKAQVDAVEVGSINKIVTADRNYTDYAQGGAALTSHPLDVALLSSGFFEIATEEGTMYTRNGSFSLDDQGYLTLQGIGRVQGQSGDIYLGTDAITIDAKGNIYEEGTGRYFGTLSVVDFENYDETLTKTDNGMFVSSGTATQADANMMQYAVESSNVDMVEQMTDMMASQRTLQSSAQIMQMYDQLMSKIVSQLGPR